MKRIVCGPVLRLRLIQTEVLGVGAAHPSEHEAASLSTRPEQVPRFGRWNAIRLVAPLSRCKVQPPRRVTDTWSRSSWLVFWYNPSIHPPVETWSSSKEKTFIISGQKCHWAFHSSVQVWLLAAQLCTKRDFLMEVRPSTSSLLTFKGTITLVLEKLNSWLHLSISTKLKWTVSPPDI